MKHTRNSVHMLAGQFSLLVSGAIINFGLGRWLGPSSYGQFGVVYAIATMLNLLLTPGMLQAVSKFVAQNPKKGKQYAGGLLKDQLALGLGLGLLYALLSYPIALALNDVSLWPFLLLLTPLPIVYSLSAVLSGYATGSGRFSIQASQYIVSSVSRTILTIALAYFFFIQGALLAVIGASIISMVFLFRTTNVIPRGKAPAGIYRLALPLTVFTVLLTLFTSIDLFMVKSLLADNAQAGFYTAAGAVARVPYFLLTALGLIFMPTIAASAPEKVVPFIQSAFRYVFMFLIPGTVILFFTSDHFVILLYQSEYLAAGTALSILLIGAAGMTVVYLLSTILNARQQPYVPVVIATLMILMSVGINLFLIPQLGITGAAIGTSVAALLAGFILYFFTLVKIGNPFNYLSLARIGIASVVVGYAATYPLGNKFLLPFFYGILGALYFVILFALREISSNDVKKVKEVIPERFSAIVDRIL